MSSLQRCVSGAALDISYSVGGGGVICEESRGGGGEGGASSPLPIMGAEVCTPRHSPSAGPDPDLPAAGVTPVLSLRALPPTPPLTMEGGSVGGDAYFQSHTHGSLQQEPPAGNISSALV